MAFDKNNNEEIGKREMWAVAVGDFTYYTFHRRGK